MGLKGSKSMLTLRSLPSSVSIVPVYTTRPFEGTCVPATTLHNKLYVAGLQNPD